MPIAHTTTALAAALLLAGAAQAAEPWAVGVTQTMEHDSNVNRAPAGAEAADWVSTTGLEGRLDVPLGIQRLRAEARIAATRYRERDALNHNPYHLAAALDWSAGSDSGLQGEAGVNLASRLYAQDQSLTGAPAADERQLQAFWRARQGIASDWALTAGLSALRRDLSEPPLAALDQRQWAAEVGTLYQPSPDLGLRANLRLTRGSYPDRQPSLADDYRRHDVEMGAKWVWTGALDADAVLGWARESHSLPGLADTSLWYGAAMLNWRPSAKLSGQLRLDRNSDTGTRTAAPITDGAAAPAPVPTPDGLSNASISTGLGLGAIWSVAAKVGVEGRLGWVRRSLSATLAGLPSQGSDVTQTASLGLRYSPLPALDLGCRVGREQRRVSDHGGPALSVPYAANTWGCWGQFWFGRT